MQLYYFISFRKMQLLLDYFLRSEKCNYIIFLLSENSRQRRAWISDMPQSIPNPWMIDIFLKSLPKLWTTQKLWKKLDGKNCYRKSIIRFAAPRLLCIPIPNMYKCVEIDVDFDRYTINNSFRSVILKGRRFNSKVKFPQGPSLYYVRVFWGFFEPPTHLHK